MISLLFTSLDSDFVVKVVICIWSQNKRAQVLVENTPVDKKVVNMKVALCCSKS